jgi:hypothetical protein
MENSVSWQALMYRGRTIEAIKAYRTQAGVGLADAKETIERWQAINLPPSPSYQLCCRIARRVVDVLSEYAVHGGADLSYVINVLPSSPSEVVGQNTLLHAQLAVDSSVADLVVEIEMVDVHPRLRGEVVRTHLANGVRMVWVIESDDPTVHVYTDSLSHPLYHIGTSFSGSDVLPGFTCEVGNLFT